MSDEKIPETPAAKEAPAGGAEAAPAKDKKAKAAPKPKGPSPLAKLPLVPIAVIVLALGAGAALGSLLLGPTINHARHAAAVAALTNHGKPGKAKKKKDKSKDGKAEAGKPTSYKLENIIVNPAGSQGQRFLMCSVAITADDPKALDTLREHELELRDKVVSMLSARTLERLTAAGERDSLRAELLLLIKPALGPDDDTELHVYLPQFVVQ